jgi:hypothetical protein
MKTEEQIIKEMDKTHRRIHQEINKHYNARAADEMITAKMHWEEHIKQQGYRDALAWVLMNEQQ